MTLTLFGCAVLLMFGLIFGSFFNVCIYRIPAGSSIVRPGSFCPYCSEPIRTRDNIPILSYLILAGKCHNCGHPISVRYPLVELLTGLLFVAVFLKFGFAPSLLLALIFVSILIVITFIDLDHNIIPNKVIFPSIYFGFILASAGAIAPLISNGKIAEKFSLLLPLTSHVLPYEPFIGAFAGFFILISIALIKAGGMGMGDVKLALFMGFFLGIYNLLALFIGFFLGGIIGLILMIFFKKGRKDAIPFGPFLAAGALISLIYGEPIVDWYLGRFI